MKKVHPVAAHLVMRLMSLLKDHQNPRKERPTLTIFVPQNPPLHVEILGRVSTEEGIGKVIRIGKIFNRKKKIYSVLMEFIVISDQKTKKVSVYPRLFKDDINGIEEESVTICKEKITNVDLISQSGQKKFAFTWLSDLRTEGYLVNSVFLPLQSYT